MMKHERLVPSVFEFTPRPFCDTSEDFVYNMKVIFLWYRRKVSIKCFASMPSSIRPVAMLRLNGVKHCFSLKCFEDSLEKHSKVKNILNTLKSLFKNQLDEKKLN